MLETIEQITAAYADEHATARPLLTAEDVPLSFEAITPQWLSVVLCAEFVGASVTAFQLDTADDGNSNRRRIFIQYNEAGRAARLPATVFCKASQGLANRISLGLSGAIYNEVNFYRHIRPELNIEAPVCRLAVANEAMNSLIMLDDLGADTQFCTHLTDITRENAEAQMRVLAALHGRYLESPQLDSRLTARFPTWEAFFRKLDYPDFQRACDTGFALAEDVMPARLRTRRGEIWTATRASVERHRQLPHTLTHGDVHLRNWYFKNQGAAGLYDWQVASLGHWSRDVVYALSTSLTVDNRRRWERDLLGYYFEELQRVAGRRLSFDGAFDAYRQQLMSVLAFWTITINPAPGMPDMQPRDATLEFIRRITHAIDDLESLDSF